MCAAKGGVDNDRLVEGRYEKSLESGRYHNTRAIFTELLLRKVRRISTNRCSLLSNHLFLRGKIINVYPIRVRSFKASEIC